MPSELETILRLVADGHLSPDEAAPIIEALSPSRAPEPGGLRNHAEELRRTATEARERARAARDAARAARDSGRSVLHGRQVRIRVTERGRQVVNLRIPLAFADKALRMVPGIGEEQAARIRAAIDAETIGPIVDVEDEGGSGVLITVE